MSIEVFGILAAGFLTLCIYSFLYKDNPFYRFAEYLFVGVSAGYTLARAFHDVFDKKIWGPIVDPVPGTSIEWTLFIPVILGVFLILKLVPQVSWLSRWALAFVVGGTIGLSMTSRFKSDVIEQIKATISPFKAPELSAGELHKRMEAASKGLESSLSGEPESALKAINRFYQYYHRYLRVELRNQAGNSYRDSDFPMARLETAAENEKEVIRAEKASLRKLLSELQRYNAQLGLTASKLSLQIKNEEREMALFIRDGAKGKSKREVVDALYFMETRLKSKTKDLKEYSKVLNSVEASMQSLEEMLRSMENGQPSVFSASENPWNWAKGESTRWEKSISLLKTLKTLSSQCSDLARILTKNALGKESSLLSLQGIGGLKASLDARAKITARLAEADLSTPPESHWKELLYGFIIAVMALTILIYFFFSTEHTGAVGVSATLGIYFLMICFGSSFGFTIMARISLLIGRVSFLIGKFWNTLMMPFVGGS